MTQRQRLQRINLYILIQPILGILCQENSLVCSYLKNMPESLFVTSIVTRLFVHCRNCIFIRRSRSECKHECKCLQGKGSLDVCVCPLH